MASLSGMYAMSRVLSLPPKPQQEVLREAHQLARESIPLEELRVEWELLPADETGQEMLVLGVPSAALSAQVALLRSAGLKPRAVEVKGIALARAVNRERAIIVNMESSSADLVLVMNGVPRLMRTLHQASELSPERRTAALARAVEQTVGYHNANSPARPITEDVPIFVVGTLAEDPAVAQLLADHLPYPLEPFVSPLEMPPHLPAARYAASIGLALRPPPRAKLGQVPGSALPLHINLIPQSPPFWIPTPGRGLYVAAVVAGLAGALFLSQQATAQRAFLPSLRQEQAFWKLEEARQKSQRDAVIEKEKAVSSFTELMSRKGGNVRLVNLLRSLAPQGITINTFALSESSVTVGGSSTGPQALIEFVRALRASGKTAENGAFRRHFSEVPFSSVGQGGGSFSLALPLAR